jgi:hypothetical protein
MTDDIYTDGGERIHFTHVVNDLNIGEAPLPEGVDKSGTATTTSGGLTVPANDQRKGLVGQNLSTTTNIGINEHGGVAAIGTAGTFTVGPLATFQISTQNQINFVSASGNVPVTMTEY